jgi:ABC-type glucose/galactose transport system permease subunit
MAPPEGVISASLLILIVVAIAIGAGVGLLLGDALPGTRAIALTAGFSATIIASIARYKLVFMGAHKGPDEARIPMVLVVNAAIASIAGSLAAHDLMGFVGAQTSPALLGAFAGLISAVLMAMLMITYHSNPSPRR